MSTIAAIVTAATLMGIISTTPLAAYASDIDSGETNIDQGLRPENSGSGESDNINCVEQLIEASVDEEECDLGEEEVVEREPEPETTTLLVCKEMDPNSLGSPSGFTFTVTGNGPDPATFVGDPNCVEVSIGPGEYAVSEVNNVGGALISVSIEGQCMPDPNDRQRATGEIQAGETQECRFTNLVSD
jgi:hypothetical protein